MGWSKDQKLSTLNLLTFKIIYRFLKIRFPGPNRLFWRICLQNLVFEISCVGEDLARFQKPLFWTPDITPALVFHVIFVEPKMASREPCPPRSHNLKIFTGLDEIVCPKVQTKVSDHLHRNLRLGENRPVRSYQKTTVNFNIKFGLKIFFCKIWE